jgi:regulator of nonsense transcripts 2
LVQRREWKSELRKCNLNVDNRPEESDLHKLDSSLKKNTAFVRKVKNFTEAQKEAILKEMTTLNLTKYIGEVASGIVEAKLKMNDLPGIIEIASKYDFLTVIFCYSLLLLHLRNDDKATQLVE